MLRSSRTVLVTGAAGVIGAAVAQRLAGRDDTVIALDVQPRPPRLRDVVSPENWVEADIGNWDEVCQALAGRGIGFAVHTAATVTNAANSDPRRAVAVNLGGVTNILEMARSEAWRGVVHFSSRVVYGRVEDPYCHPTYRPVPEDHPLGPLNMYATTKVCGEMIARRFATSYGVPVICLRGSAIYGPGKNAGHGSTSALSLVIEAACRGEGVEVRGAEQREDFIYMKDLAKAAVAAVDLLERGSTAFEVVNVAAGEGVTLRRFAEIVTRVTGTPVPVAPGIGLMDRDSRQSFVLDIARARDLLGYEPEFDLQSGIADYVGEFRAANGLPLNPGTRVEELNQ